MSISNHFENMEEVEEYVLRAEKLLPVHEAELIRYLCGLYKNEGISERVKINGVEVPIDASIADIVRSFNELGFSTLACCSGLKKNMRVQNTA